MSTRGMRPSQARSGRCVIRTGIDSVMTALNVLACSRRPNGFARLRRVLRRLSRLFACGNFEHPGATLRARSFVPGRPFFMVMGLAPLIWRWVLHFMQ